MATGTFAVRLPDGTEVRLEDLSFTELQELEEAAGERWPTILVSPATTAQCAAAVWDFLCKRAGITDPPPLTPATMAGLDKGEDTTNDGVFFLTSDDRPQSYVDGEPAPKAEDAPKTPG